MLRFSAAFHPTFGRGHCPLVGLDGLEPSTSRLSGARSNHLSYKPLAFGVSLASESGGDDGNRTHDPLLAGQVLSQLSYTPMEGLPSFKERRTSPSVRSLKTEQQKILKATSVPSGLLHPDSDRPVMICHGLHRKEVIQPHLPIRLPCYDFTPVANPTFGSVLLR